MALHTRKSLEKLRSKMHKDSLLDYLMIEQKLSFTNAIDQIAFFYDMDSEMEYIKFDDSQENP